MSFNALNIGASALGGALGGGGDIGTRERRKARYTLRRGRDRALGEYDELMDLVNRGFDANVLADDPVYQFAQSEGQRAATRRANALGHGNSGNILAALADRAAGTAGQYGLQSHRDRMNRLFNIAGDRARIHSGTGSNLANIWMGGALAQQQQGNIRGQSYANALGQGIENYLLYSLLNEEQPTFRGNPHF